MKLIMQPTCFTCGQACIAMIAGKSVDEVIIDMKTDGATSIGQLIEILDLYGIRHAVFEHYERMVCAGIKRTPRVCKNIVFMRLPDVL